MALPETAAPMRRTDVAPDVARMDLRRLLTRSFASRQPFVSISGTSWEAAAQESMADSTRHV